MEARDRDRTSTPRVVVVLDELADLAATGGKAVLESLGRLAQRGREAGLHVVACTQKPSASVLGAVTKANFPVRLVGRVTSLEDARVAAGLGGTGAERLSGRGDFLAVSAAGVTRFQAAFTPPTEIAALVQRLNAGHRGWEVVDREAENVEETRPGKHPIPLKLSLPFGRILQRAQVS